MSAGLNAYQEKVLAEMLAITDVDGANVLEIGGTPPWGIPEAMIDAGARSVTTLNYRRDLNDLFVTDRIQFKNIDARRMSAALQPGFELVLGIAVLEHLPNLENVLAEAASLLTKQGLLILHGAAFWSSKWGHHVFVHIDGEKYEFNDNNPIDDWSHLYFDHSEMLEHLTREKHLPITHARSICEYVYSNPILNRYHYEDILGAFSRAGWQITHLRNTNWGPPPDDEIRKKILDKRGHYAEIYSNYTCGELLIAAIPCSSA